MKNKSLILRSLGILTATSLLLCSCSSDKKSETKSQKTKLYENYYSLSEVYNAEDSEEKLDNILKNYDTEWADRYSFDKDNFEICDNAIREIRTYSGTFEKDGDNELTFDYEKVISEMSEETYNQLTEEERENISRIREVLIDGEYETRSGRINKELLQKYNENSPFVAANFQPMYEIDRTRFFLVPRFEFVISDANSGSYTPNFNFEKILSGNFICTETYGVELDGKYSYGKSFKLDYNPINTFLQTPMRVYDERTDMLQQICDFLGIKSYKIFDEQELNFDKDKGFKDTVYYKNGKEVNSYDYNTTISFKDGEWTWENQDGDELLKGEYEESKDYPGLIKLSSTEWELYESLGEFELLIYISESGEIFTPHYIALNQFN